MDAIGDDTILWSSLAILVIAGIVTLIRGSVITGMVLIVLGRSWGRAA